MRLKMYFNLATRGRGIIAEIRIKRNVQRQITLFTLSYLCKYACMLALWQAYL